MNTTRQTRTALAAFVALFVVFSAPVFAQTDPALIDAIKQGFNDLRDELRQRPTQAQPTPTPSQPVTVTPALEDRIQQLERRVTAQDTRLGDHDTALAAQDRRLQRVESLVGRIAPRQEATAAPRKPATTGPAAQASANGGLARVKVTPPAAEEFLSVAFTGDIPSQKDLAGIKNLLGQYDLVQIVALPAPGKDDVERGIRTAARKAALSAAYGSAVVTRPPANDMEAAHLVGGAPKDSGAVFHLRLKGASMATALPTP